MSLRYLLVVLQCPDNSYIKYTYCLYLDIVEGVHFAVCHVLFKRRVKNTIKFSTKLLTLLCTFTHIFCWFYASHGDHIPFWEIMKFILSGFNGLSIFWLLRTMVHLDACLVQWPSLFSSCMVNKITSMSSWGGLTMSLLHRECMTPLLSIVTLYGHWLVNPDKSRQGKWVVGHQIAKPQPFWYLYLWQTSLSAFV